MATTTRFRALESGPCVVATLTSEECWRLLARKAFGRFAISDGRGVDMFPVAYDVVEDTVVFRCTPGAKSALLAGGLDMAFEVDGGDDEGGMRWSVVLNGWARHLESGDEVTPSTPPNIPSDAEIPPTRALVRLTPVSITGRAFRAVPAGAREDQRTASRVRHALRRRRDLDAAGVRVVADAGFVTLVGEVGSAAARLAARQAAEEIPEVLGVEDLMTFRLAASEWQFSPSVAPGPVPA